MYCCTYVWTYNLSPMTTTMMMVGACSCMSVCEFVCVSVCILFSKIYFSHTRRHKHTIIFSIESLNFVMETFCFDIKFKEQYNVVIANSKYIHSKTDKSNFNTRVTSIEIVDVFTFCTQRNERERERGLHTSIWQTIFRF